MIVTIDPERITDRLFGGPYFRAFTTADGRFLKCVQSGAIFDGSALHEAWMEGRNLPSILEPAQTPEKSPETGQV